MKGTPKPRIYVHLVGKLDELTYKYQSGQSVTALAKEYNVTRMVLTHFFKKNGFAIKPTTSNVNGREQEIIQAYLSGTSKSDLSGSFKICTSTISKILDNANIISRKPGEASRKYMINESILDVIDSEVKAYFLGFFYADGHNNEPKGHLSIEIGVKDKHILEQFNILFDNMKPIQDTKPGYCKFILHSKRLSGRMVELGCSRKKTYNLQFPEWLEPSLIPHFMRGYTDGDGCIISKGKQNIVSVIGAERFVRRYAEVLTINCKVNTVVKESRSLGIYNCFIHGTRQALRVIDFLYKDATIYLDRKKVKAQQIREWSNSSGRG